MQPADTLLAWAVALGTTKNIPINLAIMCVLTGWTLRRNLLLLPWPTGSDERAARSLPPWFKLWTLATTSGNLMAFLMINQTEHMRALAMWLRTASIGWLLTNSIAVLAVAPPVGRSAMTDVHARNVMLEAALLPPIVALGVALFLPDALRDAGEYAGPLLLAYASQSLVWPYFILRCWPEWRESVPGLRSVWPKEEKPSNFVQ